MDAFVQFFWSTGVLLIVDGVSKQATRLTRQHLQTQTSSERKGLLICSNKQEVQPSKACWEGANIADLCWIPRKRFKINASLWIQHIFHHAVNHTQCRSIIRRRSHGKWKSTFDFFFLYKVPTAIFQFSSLTSPDEISQFYGNPYYSHRKHRSLMLILLSTYASVLHKTCKNTFLC